MEVTRNNPPTCEEKSMWSKGEEEKRLDLKAKAIKAYCKRNGYSGPDGLAKAINALKYNLPL